MEIQLQGQPGVQVTREQALDTLLRHAYPYASFLCRKLLSDPEEADAITRQVLEIICRQHQALEKPEAFLGWVNRMTARLCVHALKNSGYTFTFEGAWGPEPEEARSPTGALNSRELAMQLEQRVDALPLNLRVCIYLHDYAQLTVREAARLMQVSDGEICYALQEATVQLGTLTVENGLRGSYTVCPMPYLGFFLRQCARMTEDANAASRMIWRILNPDFPEISFEPPEEEPNDWAENWNMPEETNAQKGKKSNLVPILFAIFAVLCAVCVGLAAAVAVHG